MYETGSETESSCRCNIQVEDCQQIKIPTWVPTSQAFRCRLLESLLFVTDSLGSTKHLFCDYSAIASQSASCASGVCSSISQY